ncbi:MAG: FMN-binding protein [Calditrichia bacterium]|nr:FMN-binding protein [Calditrichia bacterium]
MREILKLVLVLSLICGVSAATLQVVRVNLEPVIEKQNDYYVRGPALERLFDQPASNLLSNKIVFEVGEEQYPIFYTIKEGKLTGMAIEAIGKGGYGGDLSLMIGADLEKDVLLGMEIIKHSETPGIGSKIEKESFREQWEKHTVAEQIKLKNDGGKIQSISGATYSMKAVMNASQRIYDLIQANRDKIEEMVKEKESNQ